MTNDSVARPVPDHPIPLPCPFCGFDAAEETIVDTNEGVAHTPWYAARCVKCSFQMDGARDFAEAMAQWNHRVPTPAPSGQAGAHFQPMRPGAPVLEALTLWRSFWETEHADALLLTGRQADELCTLLNVSFDGKPSAVPPDVEAAIDALASRAYFCALAQGEEERSEFYASRAEARAALLAIYTPRSSEAPHPAAPGIQSEIEPDDAKGHRSTQHEGGERREVGGCDAVRPGGVQSGERPSHHEARGDDQELTGRSGRGTNHPFPDAAPPVPSRADVETAARLLADRWPTFGGEASFEMLCADVADALALSSRVPGAGQTPFDAKAEADALCAKFPMLSREDIADAFREAMTDEAQMLLCHDCQSRPFTIETDDSGDIVGRCWECYAKVMTEALEEAREGARFWLPPRKAPDQAPVFAEIVENGPDRREAWAIGWNACRAEALNSHEDVAALSAGAGQTRAGDWMTEDDAFDLMRSLLTASRNQMPLAPIVMGAMRHATVPSSPTTSAE